MPSLPSESAAALDVPARPSVRALAVTAIEPDPFQPRKEYDPEAIARLAGSLESLGQLQPILVRTGPVPGRYTIIVGERRWRAAEHAGLATIDALVLDGTLSRPRVLEMQVVENLLREELNPLEQALAFRRLMETRFWTAAQLARELRVSESTVSRALALLELPRPIQTEVAAGRVLPSVARELGRVANPARRRVLTSRAAVEGLSRAAVRAEVEAGAEIEERAGEGAPALSPAPAGASLPQYQRRVFQVKEGTVILELNLPGGPRAALGAVLEVSDRLLCTIENPEEDED